LLALTVMPAGLVEARPQLDVSVSEDAARVGDVVTVRISAHGNEGLLWGEPRVITEPNGPWEVVGGPRELEGARPPAWELMLTPMELGELELPDIRIVVREPDGEPLEISAEIVSIVTVESVLPSDDEVEPAPLRDPLGVSGFPWEWVVPTAIPLLALIAAIIGWGRRRRGSVVPQTASLLPPLAELETLLLELDSKVGRDPAEGICDRLAAGMRRYLERRSGQPAEEMTSFELRVMARNFGWPDAVQRGVQLVLAVADGVRFGRFPTDDAELRKSISTTRETAGELDSFLVAEEEEPEVVEVAG
jgi:hypothetical protein